MGIVARLLRLCRADLHGLLDQIEDRELLLNQYLREMAAALARTKTQLEGRDACRARMMRALAVHRDKVRALEDDIALAVARGREDIARKLIRAVLPRRQSLEALHARLEQLRDEARAGQDAYARQVTAYEQISRRAKVIANRQQTDGDVPADRERPNGPANQAGDAEIEMELIRHKEALEAGRAS